MTVLRGGKPVYGATVGILMFVMISIVSMISLVFLRKREVSV